jgi:hypothetical protein
MWRKFGPLPVVLLAVTLGVGAYLHASGHALPGLPLRQLPASLAQAIAANDSVALAAAARARCGLLSGKPRRACFEDVLLQLVKQDRVRLAMGTLDLLGQRDPDIRRFGHDYSHVVGINAWAPGKDLGAAYAACNELFQSGCYHGVIQAYFAYEGTDSAKVVGLCREHAEMRDDNWLHFQCVHGIGHGLVQDYGMNLPRALAGCDLLGTYFDTESCYGGAFMEFILGGRGQSHHVHLPAGAGKAADSAAGRGMAGMDHDMPGMEHGPAPSRTWPPFKARDPGDPYYPCSKLGSRYQRACYGMQAGLIVETTGLDFAKVAAVCDSAPGPMRPVCYQGIGTYVSGVTARDSRLAIRACSLGSPRWRPWCFVGVVKNFIDVTAKTDDGVAFCRLLDAPDIASSCWNAVGEQAAFMFRDPEPRERVCRNADGAMAASCRYGARLTNVRPPELPSG